MKIVIIDDEILLSNKIGKKLENYGYSVVIYHSCEKFFANPPTNTDLYVIDISLRDGSGMDIIAWLREKDIQSPIMIISWYGDTDNITHWLDIWADDYMIKPLVPDEFLARIRALLRRPIWRKETLAIVYKNISYNPDKKECYVDGVYVPMPHKESLVIELLLMKKWETIKREELIGYVWWEIRLELFSDNTLNATISKIKKKLWDQVKIKTLYKTGYMLI